MAPDPVPAPVLDSRLHDEPARVRAVERTGLLDTPREPQFDAITALVRDVLDVPICAVSLVDQERQFFKTIHGADVRETPRSLAFCDHTIRIRDTTVIEDARRDARFQFHPWVSGEPHLRSYAGAPLVTAEQYQVGALCVVDLRPRAFSVGELSTLKRFAAVVVEAIELRSLAQEDYLTGVRSRRGFCEEVARAVHRHARDAQAAALITLDIDHFKRINDCFGHGVGDEVLKAVAEALRGMLRKDHPIGRLGGEEFGILLPGATVADAMACAERLRAAIEAIDSPDLPRVTGSFGVAPLMPGATVAEWTAASDRALYAAKRSGRNRCVMANDGVERRVEPCFDGPTNYYLRG